MSQADLRQAKADSARRTLAAAATFASLHATARPLLQKTMRVPGLGAVVVRFEWPGVLSVHDPRTGELLARSRAGEPFELDHVQVRPL
ncbi:hypothetical protein [Hydrogenophaga sp. OTU3427]|uniref:hypothetical protein n=1 Tax=Hydrogenophaga sp. OTU3427 TaxID=3043856 RepID=UPI00313B74D3